MKLAKDLLPNMKHKGKELFPSIISTANNLVWEAKENKPRKPPKTKPKETFKKCVVINMLP